LDLVNGRAAEHPDNPTSCPIVLAPGVPVSVEVRVGVQAGQGTIEVDLNARRIIAWHGPLTQLSTNPKWDPHRTLGLILCDAEVVVEQLELTPLDRGTYAWEPLPAGARRPPAGTEVRSAPCTIDLLSLVDLHRGVFFAAARRTPEGLELNAEKKIGQIALPVWPHGRYELTGSFTIATGTSHMLYIPLPHTRCLWSWAPPALALIGGISQNDRRNPSRDDSRKCEAGRPHAFRIQVACGGETADIAVEMDGRAFSRWTGPETALSLEPSLELPNARTFGLGVYRGSLIHELKLKMVDGEAWVLQGASPPR
jgi:hypothetical protein